MTIVNNRAPVQGLIAYHKPQGYQNSRICDNIKANESSWGLDPRVWRKWFTVSNSYKPVVPGHTYAQALKSDGGKPPYPTDSKLPFKQPSQTVSSVDKSQKSRHSSPVNMVGESHNLLSTISVANGFAPLAVLKSDHGVTGP